MTEYQTRVAQTLKALIYKEDNFDLDILQKYIGKKIGDRFYKLKNSFKVVAYETQLEDWAMDIVANMLSEDAFFENWKEEYPDSSKIDTEKLFKKFTDKITKQIKKIYDKYLTMRIDGVGDAYELPVDKFGEVLDLNNIGKSKRTKVRKIHDDDGENGEFASDEIRPDDEEKESYNEEEEE